jgi:hypothetical protein
MVSSEGVRMKRNLGKCTNSKGTRAEELKASAVGPGADAAGTGRFSNQGQGCCGNAFTLSFARVKLQWAESVLGEAAVQ